MKEVSGGVITSSSKFYVPNYVDHLYFTVGNAVYCYTISDMLGNVVPGNSHKLFDLTQYGYDANAVITDVCVSRSEKTLLLGVSRYGTDAEAMRLNQPVVSLEFPWMWRLNTRRIGVTGVYKTGLL